jgi:alginate O-acetyltransferase complex protein AlgI
MLFASLDFLLFFLPVLAGYWALANRPVTRCWLLLIASYFFYCASARPAYGQPTTPWYFVGLIGLSTLLDYFSALVIDSSPPRSRERNLALAISVTGNLGLLGCFKYTEFGLQVLRDTSAALGLTLHLPMVHLLLPIGISFYTFQSLSYTIDVWRGTLKAETSLLRFALFVAFFPQLVAGPIQRAADLLPQMRQHLRVDRDDVDFAFFRIAKGLFKKVVLADFVAAQFTDIVFSAPERYSSLENLFALYAFTLQIYGDFSGYSDIAIGVARLLGYRMPENFERPYQSRDVSEFWRRWHMTLSTWLRDYVFFPLGGSRCGEARTYLNLWITLMLVGMWHGASWNFVIYANLHAAAMVYSRFNRSQAEKHGVVNAGVVLLVAGIFAAIAWALGALFLKLETTECGLLSAFIFVLVAVNTVLPRDSRSPIWIAAHVLLTFHFTTLSRIFFRSDSLDQARQMVLKIVRWDGLGVRDGLFQYQGLRDWALAHEAGLGGFTGSLLALAEWLVLAVIAFGTVVHFTPARWLDGSGLRVFRRAPAPALGLAFAVGVLLLARLTAGPRANIYFAF